MGTGDVFALLIAVLIPTALIGYTLAPYWWVMVALVGLAFAFLAVCLINTVGLLLAKFLNAAPITGVRRALGASRRRHCGRSPSVVRRCMRRRPCPVNASRRCIVQRLSHMTRSPTRHVCA